MKIKENRPIVAPSGRGKAVPAFSPGKHNQHYPILPIPFGISGATGMPSSEFSVMASRFIQNNTMNHDDIEYYASIQDSPPYDVNRRINAHGAPSMLQLTLDAGGDPIQALEDDDEEYVHETYELLDAYEDETEFQNDEASVAGMVAGYTAPLGMNPQVPDNKRKKRSPAKAVGSSFGNAKPFKSTK